MAPDEELKKRVGRKLTKRRKPQRHPSVQYPERFQDGNDAHEDVTAPPGQNAQYMNQSVFSMIAAAGSKVDFNSRFDDESSDSDGEQEDTNARGLAVQGVELPLEKDTKEQGEPGVQRPKSGRHGRKPSENKLLRSLPKLNLRTVKEKNYMSGSTHLPSPEAVAPHESPRPVTPRDAPVMSRMLEAQAQLSSSILSLDQREDALEKSARLLESSTSLVTRLMEIFGYDEREEVISGSFSGTVCLYCSLIPFPEYPCWLLQSVLLQGYMYITQNHICFYAYLPKKSVSISRCTIGYRKLTAH